MKANELRIGNKVLNDNVENTIIGILQENINIVNLKTKQGNIINANINLIKPIELTEKWLIKSEYTEELKEWKGNGQDYQPETSKTKQRRFYLKEDIYLVFQYFSYRANEEDEWITDKSISIEYYGDLIQLTKYYIHTFQNLYFELMGKELNINIL